MGREVRKVPPNWNHPLDERGQLQAMFDQSFSEAFAEWLSEFDRIRADNLTDDERGCFTSTPPLLDWIKDNSCPDPVYYRPWADTEATWFQVWETVSEGSPVTPPFATEEELINYLVEHGDFWQQKRWARGDRYMQPNPPGCSREDAEKFVRLGSYPSLVIFNGVASTAY